MNLKRKSLWRAFSAVRTCLCMLVAVAAGMPPCFAAPAEKRSDSIPTAQVMIHDPVMAKQGDTYYLFATGQGVTVMSSPDLKHWAFEPPVFSEPPRWAVETVKGYQGHTWAPDIVFHDGQYHLFYSCSTFGRNASAIGHATNPTLCPDSPRFRWTDRGMILQSVPNRDNWNAIDPCVVVDEQGTPWMAFGSFWDGIKMVKLTPDMSGLARPEEWHALSRREGGEKAVEAPFILKHGAYYYLFVSFDYCCRGKESNYKVVVGRSEKVTGPYLDKDGRAMTRGGGSVVFQGNEEYAGAGHSAAYRWDGKDYFVCHAYSVADNGAPRLIIREMTWTPDGWPVVEW